MDSDTAALRQRLEDQPAPKSHHRLSGTAPSSLFRFPAAEMPPSWVIFETLAFGTVLQALKNPTRRNQKLIAKVFGLDGTVIPAIPASATPTTVITSASGSPTCR